MGIGFVIILHLIVLAFISGIIAAISVSITLLFFENKEKRKRQVFSATFLPFQFFFTIYILGGLGVVIVSEFKGIDIGIGDSFYVPINETCEIHMIDMIDNAYLNCNDLSVISQISKILATEDTIFGETENGNFFCYDINSSEIRQYTDFMELMTIEKSSNIQLIEISEYYHKRRNEIAGTAIIIVGIIALVATIMIMWLTRKLVLKIEKIKQTLTKSS